MVASHEPLIARPSSQPMGKAGVWSKLAWTQDLLAKHALVRRRHARQAEPGADYGPAGETATSCSIHASMVRKDPILFCLHC